MGKPNTTTLCSRAIRGIQFEVQFDGPAPGHIVLANADENARVRASTKTERAVFFIEPMSLELFA